MGSECSNCSKCDLGIISESQNEIDRQSLEYRKGNLKRDELILKENTEIIKYYNNYLPTIIFLQIKIKKYLHKLKQSINPKDDFYNKYYGNIDLSQENLEIIGNNNELEDTPKKYQLNHKIQNSNHEFRTLSQKYSSFQNNNNESKEENESYKVKNYQIKKKCKIYRRYDKWKTGWIWYTRMGRWSQI